MQRTINTRFIKKYKTKVYLDESDRKCVKLHDTVVFILDKDNHTVTLNTGGWESRTTKDRINAAAREFGIPIQVYQKNYEWFIDYGQNPKMPFYNGITLQIP
jgi:hypothetical protein